MPKDETINHISPNPLFRKRKGEREGRGGRGANVRWGKKGQEDEAGGRAEESPEGKEMVRRG